MPRQPRNTERARDLRRAMSPAEAILWKTLRDRRFADFKFRRQHSIGPFYADFCCIETRLIIELDGESHLKEKVRDQARTDFLNREGWCVLRFWNTQIFYELEAVLEAIYRACVQRATD